MRWRAQKRGVVAATQRVNQAVQQPGDHEVHQARAERPRKRHRRVARGKSQKALHVKLATRAQLRQRRRVACRFVEARHVRDEDVEL